METTIEQRINDAFDRLETPERAMATRAAFRAPASGESVRGAERRRLQENAAYMQHLTRLERAGKVATPADIERFEKDLSGRLDAERDQRIENNRRWLAEMAVEDAAYGEYRRARIAAAKAQIDSLDNIAFAQDLVIHASTFEPGAMRCVYSESRALTRLELEWETTRLSNIVHDCRQRVRLTQREYRGGYRHGEYEIELAVELLESITEIVIELRAAEAALAELGVVVPEHVDRGADWYVEFKRRVLREDEAVRADRAEWRATWKLAQPGL